MRVKKLSANRRPKAGEDDVSSDSNTATSSSSPARKWVSPTKSRGDGSSASATSNAEIGSHSPTDPSGVHPIELSDSVQAHFFAQATTSQALQHTSSHLLFGNVLHMANNSHPHQMTASRDMTGRKPATMRKTTGAVNWREQVSSAVRDEIHAKIVEYLKALKPNAPEKVVARLPGLANRMEESLLQLANSQDEYADLKSLAPRLNAIQQTNAKKLLQQQTVSSPHVQDNSNSNSSTTGSHDITMSGRTPLSEDQARFVFQCLQSWRQKLVSMYGVDPWDIMPNPILAKIAVFAPSTEQELAICGVSDDLSARFGSSLLKELQLICGSTASARNAASPSNTKSRNATTTTAKASRKAESAAKRPTDPKKRKTSNLAPAGDHGNSRLAPAPPSAFMMPPPSTGAGGAPMLSSSQMLFRHNGMDSLPTLLPSATASSVVSSAMAMNANNLAKSPYTNAASQARLSPVPLFSRLSQSPPSQQQSDAQQENHMHLLAQGANHMSKQQQDAKTIEMYEQELNRMRWQLHQSQQEKAQLEDEVQRLRRQLGAAQDPRQSVASQ